MRTMRSPFIGQPVRSSAVVVRRAAGAAIVSAMKPFTHILSMLLPLWAFQGNAQAQQFVVTPASAEGLAGEPLVIRLSGLPPDAEVTLSARRTVREWTGGSRTYSASARFKTSAAGTLELASAVPLDGGSYAGADPRGLF